MIKGISQSPGRRLPFTDSRPLLVGSPLGLCGFIGRRAGLMGGGFGGGTLLDLAAARSGTQVLQLQCTCL